MRNTLHVDNILPRRLLALEEDVDIDDDDNLKAKQPQGEQEVEVLHVVDRRHVEEVVQRRGEVAHALDHADEGEYLEKLSLSIICKD